MVLLARNMILCCILSIVFLVPINAKPYSKYGRTCGDIGCPSSEVCVMAYESCNYGARENTDCGRYPTCKRREDGSKSQSSDPSLNPLPENTRLSTSSRDSSVAANIPKSNNKPMIFDGLPAQGTGAASPPLWPNIPQQSPNYPQNPGQYQPNAPAWPNNYPQQPGYPQQPAYNPQQPYVPQQPYNPQQPYVPQQPYNPYSPGQNTNQYPKQPSVKQPSLLDEFLYGKDKRSGRGASANLIPSILTLICSTILLMSYHLH